MTRISAGQTLDVKCWLAFSCPAGVGMKDFLKIVSFAVWGAYFITAFCKLLRGVSMVRNVNLCDPQLSLHVGQGRTPSFRAGYLPGAGIMLTIHIIANDGNKKDAPVYNTIK